MVVDLVKLLIVEQEAKNDENLTKRVENLNIKQLAKSNIFYVNFFSKKNSGHNFFITWIRICYTGTMYADPHQQIFNTEIIK